MKHTKFLMVGAALALMTSVAAHAQELRVAGGASPNHPSTYMY